MQCRSKVIFGLQLVPELGYILTQVQQLQLYPFSWYRCPNNWCVRQVHLKTCAYGTWCQTKYWECHVFLAVSIHFSLSPHSVASSQHRHAFGWKYSSLKLMVDVWSFFSTSTMRLEMKVESLTFQAYHWQVEILILCCLIGGWSLVLMESQMMCALAPTYPKYIHHLHWVGLFKLFHMVSAHPYSCEINLQVFPFQLLL